MFDNLPKQRVYWSWETGLTTLGALALQTGMRSLRVAGLEKIYTGQTSVEEVVRETVL